MVSAKTLIKKGFMPLELVPAFNTRMLADKLSVITKSNTLDTRTSTQWTTYSLPWLPGARRHLAIPNPHNQVILCNTISENWSEISKFYKRSNISLSKPEAHPRRAVAPAIHFRQIPQKQLLAFPECRVLLRADASRYYTSIYTHSIPWAVHGKPIAKKNHGDKLWGNKVDRMVRNTQDQQTKGIPIGPDTSLIVSELIGTAVDCILSDQLARRKIELKGHRYLDDYFLYFLHEREAHEAQACLEHAMKEFELELNASKSRILPLPEPSEDSWLGQLERFRFQASRQTLDVCDFFNTAFRLAREHPNDRVLKSAASIVKRRSLRGDAWPALQQLLLRSALADGSALPVVSQIFSAALERDHAIDRNAVKDTLSNIISFGAPGRRSHEVAWSLWILRNIDIQIPDTVAASVVQMCDPICSIILLDIRERGLIAGDIDVSSWAPLLDSHELLKSNWIFSYEVSAHRWMRRTDKFDYVNEIPFFSLLQREHVSFYLEDAEDDISDVATLLPDLDPFPDPEADIGHHDDDQREY